MAVTVQSPAGLAQIRNAPKIDTSDFTLPTVKTVPKKDLSDYLLFIYGEKKIGKTTLANMFPNSLHLFFEPGGKDLEAYAREIKFWEQFIKTVDLLLTPAGDAFENVIVDTADVAYERVFRYSNDQNGIDYPLNDDFGKTWKDITKEMKSQFDRLLGSGKGVILISHAQESEIKTRNMGTWTKIVPTLPKQAVTFIAGIADMNAYYGYFGTERYLVIEGSDYFEAGNRMSKRHFRTPDMTQKIKAVPMGFDEEESFANLVAAFNNQQEDPHDEILEMKAVLQDRTAVLRPLSKKQAAANAS